MNRSMTKWCLLALTVLGLSALATEPIAFEYFEGRSCTIGGDLRVRWTFLDRDVRELDFGNTQPSGPGYQYLRVRTRVWGCFDVVDDVKFHVGLTNEWRY